MLSLFSSILDSLSVMNHDSLYYESNMFFILSFTSMQPT